MLIIPPAVVQLTATEHQRNRTHTTTPSFPDHWARAIHRNAFAWRYPDSGAQHDLMALQSDGCQILLRCSFHAGKVRYGTLMPLAMPDGIPPLVTENSPVLPFALNAIYHGDDILVSRE